MKKLQLLLIFCLAVTIVNAQNKHIERVEPLSWWVGMKNPNLQLMVYGDNIAQLTPQLNYKGVSIKKVIKTDNPNYLFLNIYIDKNTQPGTLDIKFTSNKKLVCNYLYLLKKRIKNASLKKGFDTSDVMYLLMPDRFANGNPQNDNVAGYPDKMNRTNPDARHGGDIQGIINHLDYLQELGVTALWSTPLMEDNQPMVSYHSYAITDYYKIDPRFGSNADYARLSAEAKKRDIKLVMDVVSNHCGKAHWWLNDMPTKDWIHNFEKYDYSNHRKTTTNDPYVSKIDYEKNFNGWFDNTMPDLNQSNPLLVNYFIQNIVWWIEFADLGGIRIDTFPYNDKNGIAEICKGITDEYPQMNIVGECWLSTPAEIAYWQKGTKNYDNYNSNLPCVMDFSLFNAIAKAFNEPEEWDKGLVRLYNSLAMDYMYGDANNILIFAENHDTNHIMSVVNGDMGKYKNIMALLATTRGIPQIYVGTELLAKGQKSDGDGVMRTDFKGGWKGDKRNAFTKEGRTKKEQEAFYYLKKLLNWRKNNAVIHNGKLKHYSPENNTYVYFRSNADKTIMVIINKNHKKIELLLKRYGESINNFKMGVDIITHKKYDLKQNKITIRPNNPLILELK